MNATSLRAQAMIEKLHEKQYPKVYPYVFKVIIIYMVVYFLVLLLSLLLIIIPCLRGPEARRKHLWLWRKQYATDRCHSIPYYVPNGGIAFVISQIFGSLIFEIYLFLAFFTLHSPRFAQGAYQHFWLAIGNAPGFFGFWYSSFGALYTCIFSPSRTLHESNGMQKYLLHPMVMNTVCIATPIVPSLIALGWGTMSIVTAREQFKAYQALLEQIRLGHDPTFTLLAYSKAGLAFLAQFRWACLFWSLAAILSVVFYSFAIFLFLRLLKTTVEITEGRKDLEGVERTHTLRSSRFAERLRKSYYMLMWQCILLMIVSTWYLIDAIVLMIKINSVASSEGWRSLAAWLVVSSSFLLAGALVLQSWRMLIDKDDTQIILQREIKISSTSSTLNFKLPSGLKSPKSTFQ